MPLSTRLDKLRRYVELTDSDGNVVARIAAHDAVTSPNRVRVLIDAPKHITINHRKGRISDHG